MQRWRMSEEILPIVEWRRVNNVLKEFKKSLEARRARRREWKSARLLKKEDF